MRKVLVIGIFIVVFTALMLATHYLGQGFADWIQVIAELFSLIVGIICWKRERKRK